MKKKPKQPKCNCSTCIVEKVINKFNKAVGFQHLVVDRKMTLLEALNEDAKLNY